MKFNLPLLSLLFSVGFVSAQDAQQQKKIINTYDLEKSYQLQSSLLRGENDLEEKIQRYLSAHPQEKFEFSVGEKKYRIVDILEGKPVYTATDNAAAALAVKVNKLRSGGGMGLSLEGLNMTVGVWDGGWVRASHVEFMTAAGSGVSYRAAWPEHQCQWLRWIRGRS